MLSKWVPTPGANSLNMPTCTMQWCMGLPFRLSLAPFHIATLEKVLLFSQCKMVHGFSVLFHPVSHLLLSASTSHYRKYSTNSACLICVLKACHSLLPLSPSHDPVSETASLHLSNPILRTVLQVSNSPQCSIRARDDLGSCLIAWQYCLPVPYYVYPLKIGKPVPSSKLPPIH